MKKLDDEALFESLGFAWDRSCIRVDVPEYQISRVVFRFRKMLPEFVWDAAVLEGNPFTFPEVKTLLDGITVGGRRVSDQEQILNLAESSKMLVSKVVSGEFVLDKENFKDIHRVLARNEALEWGVFRGEGQERHYTPDVSLGSFGRHTPMLTLAGAQDLSKVFMVGVEKLNKHIENKLERATTFFLFGALQQFFFDGNKRTSRMMMNGVLLSSGIDAISVPAAKAQEFNEKMVNFYVSKDATEMMRFLVDCRPSMAKNNTAEDVYVPECAIDCGVKPYGKP